MMAAADRSRSEAFQKTIQRGWNFLAASLANREQYAVSQLLCRVWQQQLEIFEIAR